MQYATLHNGTKIPKLGFGTARMRGETCYKAVINALECGYTLFDTAQMYNNHKDIARALRVSKIKREKLFLESKISQNLNAQGTKEAILKILEELDTPYLDLLLLHEPFKNTLEMYKVMSEFYESGVIKALGVSNFNANLLQYFCQKVSIKPILNQCQTHIFYQQKIYLKSVPLTIWHYKAGVV